MKKADNVFPGLQKRLEIDGINKDYRNKNILNNFAEDKMVTTNYDHQQIKLPSSVRSTFLMVFSPDGSKIGSTHGDHKIYISNVKSGKVIKTLEGHPRTPWCLTFHPSLHNILASGCLAGEVRVWDLKSGACEIWINSRNTVIASLAFHPVDHVISIATCNELHFWDWRQCHKPFSALTTPSEKEKVRFVKFDQSGNKIVTGISNIPSIRSSSHHLSHSSSFLAQRNSDNISSNLSSYELNSSHLSQSNLSLSANLSLAIRRSNILSRVMSMYRQLEGLEETRANSLEFSSSSNSPELDDLNRILETSAVAERLLERFRSNNRSDLDTSFEPPLSPAALLHIEEARDFANSVTENYVNSSHSSNNSGSSLSSNTSVNLMNTFRRLYSLCIRLAQLMQNQPNVDEQENNLIDISNFGSLSNLLDRLYNALQNMSTAALTTVIAHEHIQQVRQRVTEILERLANISGYRTRLSNLRDQIYEVAERITTGSEPDLSLQRWDLIHCLWLVDMSIHLTRRMQRILAADYRLTQITLNNSSSVTQINSNETTSEAQQSLENNESSFSLPLSVNINLSVNNTNYNNTNLSEQEQDVIQNPLPSTSSGITRSRYQNNTWAILSRTNNSSSNFNIPTVRVSSPESLEENEEGNELRTRIRPRSPPLPEIHQVLHALPTERYSFFMPPTPPPTGPPSQHIWFSGVNPNWSLTGYPELGLMGGGSNFNFRIQCWNFSYFELPDLKDAQANLVVPKCRIHNDASIDISNDGDLLACLVPVESTLSINLCIYSLERKTFAQCFYVWTFGSNAISVSLSSMSRYIVVGLTSPRTSQAHLYSSSNEAITIAQVFKLNERSKSTLPSLQHIRNIDVLRGNEYFSLNSIRWLPNSGEGFIYGTNRGHLIICRPRPKDSRSSVSSHRSTTGTQTYPQRTGTLSIGTQTSDVSNFATNLYHSSSDSD